jgi:hypothetical protein
LNDTEETKVAGPSGPRISTGPAGRSLFSLTGPTVNILATGQRLRRPLVKDRQRYSQQTCVLGAATSCPLGARNLTLVYVQMKKYFLIS